jgi:hypothetical protein
MQYGKPARLNKTRLCDSWRGPAPLARLPVSINHEQETTGQAESHFRRERLTRAVLPIRLTVVPLVLTLLHTCSPPSGIAVQQDFYGPSHPFVSRQ